MAKLEKVEKTTVVTIESVHLELSFEEALAVYHVLSRVWSNSMSSRWKYVNEVYQALAEGVQDGNFYIPNDLKGDIEVIKP